MQALRGRATALLATAAFAALTILGALGTPSVPSARADGLTPLTLEQPAAGDVVFSDSAGVFATVFAGLGAFGDLVAVTDPVGDPICASLVQDDGTWSCTATTLADFFGEVSITDSATTIVRMLGAVNPPHLDPSQVDGITTDDPAFVTSGRAAPGASVAVFRDGEPACSAVADAAGDWGCALALTDAEVGTAALTATQTPTYAATASAPSPPTPLVYQLPVIVIPVVPMDPVDPVDSTPPVIRAEPAAPDSGAAGASAPSSATGSEAAPTASSSLGAEPTGEPVRVAADRPSGPLGGESGDTMAVQSVDPVDPTPGDAADRRVDGRQRPTAGMNAPASAASQPAATTSARPAASGWNDPTRFGTALRPPGAIPFGSPAFAVSVLVVAAGFLLLLALPAELLQSTIRENHHRIAPGLIRLLRRTPWTRTAPARRALTRRIARTGLVGPMVIVLITAAVSAFADPSTGFDARSVRLLLALALVMLVVNGVGIATGGLLAARLHRVATVVSPRPLTLLLVVASVIVSRLADLQPGLLFGLVLGVEFGSRLRRRPLGRITVVTSSTLLVLGIASWIAFGLLTPAWRAHPGFANQLAAEVLTGITVEAIAGLAIALLPLAFLDGSTIFSASKTAWAVLYSVVLAAFAVVILPLPSSWVEVPSLASPWAFGSAAFAVISVATWAGFRFIRPRALELSR